MMTDMTGIEWIVSTNLSLKLPSRTDLKQKKMAGPIMARNGRWEKNIPGYLRSIPERFIPL